MSDLNLTPEELELLASYENEEWQSVKNIKDQKETCARATFRKDKRTTSVFLKKTCSLYKNAPFVKAYRTRLWSQAYCTNTS
jgi:predicted DNA binding CopG/RHH family protein